jgi:signal transduction histidine kinase
MIRSLRNRLVMIYLAVAVVTVVIIFVLVRLSTERSLREYIVAEQVAVFSQALRHYHTKYNTLEGFWEACRMPSAAGLLPGLRPPPGVESEVFIRRGLSGVVDSAERALIPTREYAPGEIVGLEVGGERVAVEIDGHPIAWLIPDRGWGFDLSIEEERFLHQVNLTLALAALSAIALAVFVGRVLTGWSLKPVLRLNQAAQRIVRGKKRQPLQEGARDELGQLASTFNQMSAEMILADQERKRITAEITHDLSTPLQIISGYIEMLEEENVPLTPERILIIKTEIAHLRRLVSDLSMLAQVEAGALDLQLEVMHPAVLIEQVTRAYEPIASRDGIALKVDISPDTQPVKVDVGRMAQVLKNLVENALRHTPAGGMVQVGCGGINPVQIWVKDNGAGIEEADLPHIFERFYRGGKERGARPGKMGLGLAICKALVAAHGGSIQAQSAGKGQGTQVTISIPPSLFPHPH